MKGRDLIIYILENHLEDVDVLSDLKNLGKATVEAWCGFGRYNYTTIDDRIYIWLPEGGK